MGAGLLLVVGRFTRTATALSWLLASSLQARNPFLLDSGDILMRMMLLWCVFLPLGARWSLDARRRPTHVGDASVLSAASVALLLQFACLYLVAGLMKTGPEWRVTGTAIEMVLGQSYWKGALGDVLLGAPDLLRILSPVVVWFEILGPLVLFCPIANGPIRVAAIAGFWAFQAGLWLSIELHLFSFIAIAATLPFVPTWLWERLRVGRSDAPAETDGPSAPTLGATWANRLGQGLVVVLLAVSVAQATNTLGLIRAQPISTRAEWLLGLYQDWVMYSPGPPRWDMSFKLTGALAGGSEMALLDEAPGARWRDVQRLHETYRFKSYLEKTALIPAGKARRTNAYLSWLCREWNAEATPEGTLSRVEFSLDRHPVIGDRRLPPVRIGRRGCP